MSKVANTKLKKFIRNSVNKKDLIEKITNYDPDYVITNLTNIERLADIYYNDDNKKTTKRKRKTKNETEEVKKKQTKYQLFVQDNFQNIRKACETNSEALKKIAEM